MPKIRGVRPEYWTDEDIVELSIPARLLFIGMWNFACDNGHLDDKPKQLKMRILPADDVDVNALIDELVWHKRVTRRDGTITINRFAHHQKPHKRWWVTCDLQECTTPDAPSQQGDNGGPTVDNGGPTADVDGEGDGEGELRVTTAPRKRPSTRLPDDWQPTPSHWERRHDGIDVQREADTFRAHAEANDRRAANWNAAFTQWLLKAKPSPASQPHKGRAAQWLDLTRQLGNQQGPPRPEIGPSA